MFFPLCWIWGKRQTGKDIRKNLAGQHSQSLGQLDVELQAFFDPEDVDRRVKSEDFRLYHRFFGSLDQKRLRNKLERAYAGFEREISSARRSVPAGKTSARRRTQQMK